MHLSSSSTHVFNFQTEKYGLLSYIHVLLRGGKVLDVKGSKVLVRRFLGLLLLQPPCPEV